MMFFSDANWSDQTLEIARHRSHITKSLDVGILESVVLNPIEPLTFASEKLAESIKTRPNTWSI